MPDETAPSTVELSNEEIAVLAEIDRDLAALQAQAQGVFRLLVKKYGLQGQWKRQGNQLVRADNGVEHKE